MRRTRKWINKMVKEGHAEITWEAGNTAEVKWNHNNRRVMIWVVN